MEPVTLFHLQQIIVNTSDFNKAWNYTSAQQINKQQQGQLLYFLLSSVQIYLFIFLSITLIKKIYIITNEAKHERPLQ